MSDFAVAPHINVQDDIGFCINVDVDLAGANAAGGISNMLGHGCIYPYVIYSCWRELLFVIVSGSPEPSESDIQ